MDLLNKIFLFITTILIAIWLYKSNSEKISNFDEETIFKSAPIGAVMEYEGIII